MVEGEISCHAHKKNYILLLKVHLTRSLLFAFSGTFHKDESIDKIVVSSDDGGVLTAGKTATIAASVFPYGTGGNDHADFFYAMDASNPNWVLIGSLKPSGAGLQELKMSYTLPDGDNQAVRINFRYNGAQSPCTTSAYDDHDDLVFKVKSSPAVTTTVAPLVAQVAVYNSSLGAPSCSVGISCDSSNLLNGRGTMSGGAEPNQPNTIDTCTDGVKGTYHSDESLDGIYVRSGEIDGTGSGVNMVEGGRATIIATVWPYKTGSSDRADFYYAADASNPVWQFIATLYPSGAGQQELKTSYTIPKGINQAVRVNFRYSGSASPCSGGSYDDTDDLAFGVAENKFFTGNDFIESEPSVELPDERNNGQKKKAKEEPPVEPKEDGNGNKGNGNKGNRGYGRGNN